NLTGGPADNEFVRMIVEYENKTQVSLQIPAILILSHLSKTGSTDIKDVTKTIQQGEDAVRPILTRLIDAGLIEKIGSTSAQKFHLSASVYKKLGQKAAYVRHHGAQNIKHQASVLDYLKAYSKITRKETIILCNITEWQASYILRKLRKLGKIQVEGASRKAYYTLVND
ncbi:MAG: hypothetical protein ABIA63_03655, partial [bacterium]